MNGQHWLIGGYNEQSIYYKSLVRQLGYINDVKTFIEFKNEGDKLKTEIALNKLNGSFTGTYDLLDEYTIPRFEDNEMIYKGLGLNTEQLGESIGDCDLTSIKYYNTPKSIWELFGFQNYELEIIGNPNNPRYWAKIIPKDLSIFLREGLVVILNPNLSNGEAPDTNLNITWINDDLDINVDNIPLEINEIKTGYDYSTGMGGLTEATVYIENVGWVGSLTTLKKGKKYDFKISTDEPFLWRELLRTNRIDTFSEQDWIDVDTLGTPDYYYPVLPRYGQNGKFIEGDFPNNKIPFPLEGVITNENEFDENLICNISTDIVEDGVLSDLSGNSNLGFTISDFKPKFNEETLKPQKRKKLNKINTNKSNGAF